MPHLPTNPAHLGRAASATVEPDFTGPDGFEADTARHARGPAARLRQAGRPTPRRTAA